MPERKKNRITKDPWGFALFIIALVALLLRIWSPWEAKSQPQQQYFSQQQYFEGEGQMRQRVFSGNGLEMWMGEWGERIFVGSWGDMTDEEVRQMMIERGFSEEEIDQLMDGRRLIHGGDSQIIERRVSGGEPPMMITR